MRLAFRLLPAAIVVAALICQATPARAIGFVLGGHAGYGSYTQEDLNAAIRVLNAGTGAQDEIKAGAEYGGQVGVRLNASAVLGAGYTRLTAHATGAQGGQTSEVSVPADCWVAFLTWLPDNDKVGRVGLGVDIGLVKTQGFVEVVETGGVVDRTDYEGRGLFLAGYVVGDVQLGGRWNLYLHGGFRLANAADVDVGGEPSQYDLDYSGAFARAGLQVSLGSEPR